MKVAQMMIKRVVLTAIATVIDSLTFFFFGSFFCIHYCESIYH